MRRIFILCFLIGSVFFANGQKESTKDLARVRKISGVEAYVFCEPVRPYKVVVDAGSGFKAESLLTGGLVNKSISGRMEQFVRNVMKQNAKIDAVLYSSGKRISGIIFTDDGSVSTTGIGRISKVMGYPVFVMSEPIDNYQVVSSRGGGIKWKSLVTAGVVNNSIEEDIEAMVKKVQSRAADAILIDGGKDASAIMFK